MFFSENDQFAHNVVDDDDEDVDRDLDDLVVPADGVHKERHQAHVHDPRKEPAREKEARFAHDRLQADRLRGEDPFAVGQVGEKYRGDPRDGVGDEIMDAEKAQGVIDKEIHQRGQNAEDQIPEDLLIFPIKLRDFVGHAILR